MNMDIQKAYDRVYMDSDMKQRVLRNVKEKSERNTEEQATTVSISMEKINKHRRWPVLAASLLMVAGLAAAIGIGINGLQKKSKDGAATRVEISEKPKNENIIQITEEEFRDGIECMKTSQIGACTPEIIYASDDLVIINDYSGMLFFNPKRDICIGVLDTPKYEINHMQGSDYTVVEVSTDGKYISFVNTETKENTYLFDLNNLTLERGGTIGNIPIYKGVTFFSDDEKMMRFAEYTNTYRASSFGYATTRTGNRVYCMVPESDIGLPLTEEELETIEKLSIVVVESKVNHETGKMYYNTTIYEVFGGKSTTIVTDADLQ